MDDFERELKLGFLEEATQGLSDAEQCFLAMEESPNDPAILEKIFRLAHSLKGSSKAAGFNDVAHFTHELEGYLIKLKKGEITVQASSVNLLLRCNDHLLMMVRELRSDLNARIDSQELLDEIIRHATGQVTESPVPLTPEQGPVEGIAEAAAAPADDEIEFLNPVGGEPLAEVVQLNIPASVVAAPVPEAAKAPKAAAHAADESIRVSLNRLEKLINFVGELVIYQSVLKEQVQVSNESPLIKKTVHQISKVTKEVQDISMGLRMVPLKQTFQKMQRIVRDTSSVLGKKVSLQVSGEDTELDKTILEAINDPLVHLIRNAVDHGVESPEARRQKGKPEMGTIHLNAYHHSGNIVIEVRDDGAGIDANRLRAKAVEKGILKAGATMADRDAYHLIFHNGFSTKTEVTEVSGRGVGMDVVKTNIEQLQGEIQIDTDLGKGTTFKIVLPLTLAIIEGMIVASDNSRYVVPLAHVHESMRPDLSDVHHFAGLGEIFSLRGENIPLYTLSGLLGRKTHRKPATEYIAIVIRTEEQPFAVLVDNILGQSQVVIKQLGQECRGLPGFSGSAILGDGKPALILELGELVSKNRSASPSVGAAAVRAA